MHYKLPSFDFLFTPLHFQLRFSSEVPLNLSFAAPPISSRPVFASIRSLHNTGASSRTSTQIWIRKGHLQLIGFLPLTHPAHDTKLMLGHCSLRSDHSHLYGCLNKYLWPLSACLNYLKSVVNSGKSSPRLTPHRSKNTPTSSSNSLESLLFCWLLNRAETHTRSHNGDYF